MKKNSPLYVLLFMTAICLVFGIGIAVVNFSTLPLLERNLAMHRNRVLCAAFELPVEGNTADAFQQAVSQHLTESHTNGRPTYRRHTPGHESIGFEFSGLGFWDRITGIVVLSPDLATILNIQFLDQKETPGLGARIEEKWFTDQFKGIPVNWDDPKGGRVIVGSSPDPAARNRVDAITGATQTSMALMRFLNDELAAFRAAYSAAPQPQNPEP